MTTSRTVQFNETRWSVPCSNSNVDYCQFSYCLETCLLFSFLHAILLWLLRFSDSFAPDFLFLFRIFAFMHIFTTWKLIGCCYFSCFVSILAEEDLLLGSLLCSCSASLTIRLCMERANTHTHSWGFTKYLASLTYSPPIQLSLSYILFSLLKLISC